MTTENHHFPHTNIDTRIQNLEGALDSLKTNLLPRLTLLIDTHFADLTQQIDTHFADLTQQIEDLRIELKMQTNHATEMRTLLQTTIQNTISKLATRVHILKAQNLDEVLAHITQELPHAP